MSESIMVIKLYYCFGSAFWSGKSTAVITLADLAFKNQLIGKDFITEVG
jgi:hypothetical protein